LINHVETRLNGLTQSDSTTSTVSPSVKSSDVEYSSVIPTRIIPRNNRTNSKMLLNVLYDTGATQDNYCSTKTASYLMEQGCTYKKCNVKRVCMCANDAGKDSNNFCLPCLGVLEFDIEIFNELTNLSEQIPLRFTVIDTSYDLIIGMQTLVRHNLLFKLFSKFSTFIDKDSFLNRVHLQDELHAELIDEEYRNSRHTVANIHYNTQIKDPTSVYTREDYVSALIHKAAVVDTILLEDTDDIDHSAYEEWIEKVDRSVDENSQSESLKDLLKKVNLCKDPKLKRAIDVLCTEFQDLFKDEIGPTPADVPPFTVNYDSDAWQQPRNQVHARLLPPNTQAELKAQIDKYLKLGIIEPAPHAKAWSQVLLVRKPNGTWRFCIDFRAFNAISESKHWPLPNIRSLLLQLGFQRPKYFAVMDLTSGYYQTALDPDSKEGTAFITSSGLYQWTRVPMGLRGAPSYFQHHIGTTVLGRLKDACDAYLDDIVVAGADASSFLANLRRLLFAYRNVILL